MKTLLLLAALSTAQSNENNEMKDKFALCEQVQGLSKVVMEKRQQNFQMSELVNIAIKNDVPDLAIEMIKEAYGIPLYGTQTYKDREINEFSNKWYLACIKEMTK